MKRSNIILIHLLFWVMMVVAPNILFHLDDQRHGPEIGHIIQQFIINLVVFYMTYWVFVPFLMKKKKKTWELVFISIGWVLAFTALRLVVVYYYKEVMTPLEGRPFIFERQIAREAFGTLMFSLYAVLIYFSIEWFRERQYRFELAREKQKSEIDLLKSQMNPHFLMNTLNNLYSLVYQGSKQASNAVLKLSDIMRYMLYETKAEMVPLENEVKYLESFIELQMLRIKNQELVDLKILGEPGGRMIAPMLFIPFVENAFKHGNKHMEGEGITIRLEIDEEKIIFEVINFVSSKELQKDAEKGIGLANVQKRLELQYPDRHQLIITEREGYFKVYLEILDK